MSDNASDVQNSSATERFYVTASSTPGRQSEFRSWYDDEHVPEILSKHPAIVGVERFDLGASSVHGAVDGAGDDVARSLAIYHVAGSAREAWAGVRSGPPLGRSTACDYTTLGVAFLD